MTLKQSEYVLGHTDREQLRLIRQARALAPVTEHFLRDAGLVSGMRVLDIGCGMGDVTMLVAQRIGPAGRVVSIDLDQSSIETARMRASAAGFDNTTFRRADIGTFDDAEPFDAIVGRLVLEFLPDRRPSSADCVACCGRAESSRCRSWKLWLAYTSHLPLRMTVTTFMRDAFVAGGANTEMELPLYRAFMAADLTPPQLRVELPVGASPDFRILLHDLLLAVWTRAQALGLETAALGDLATLPQRLDDELEPASRLPASLLSSAHSRAGERNEDAPQTNQSAFPHYGRAR